MEGAGVRGTCGGKVESEVEKQWRVEYRLESGVESALQSGVVSDAESEQEWSGNWSGLGSEGGVQSKVRLGLDSGVKRGAKTGRMGKVGRRRLERKLECKEKWTLESSWRGSAMVFQALNEVCAFCWHVPPPRLPYSMVHKAWLAFVGLGSPLKFGNLTKLSCHTPLAQLASGGGKLGA